MARAISSTSCGLSRTARRKASSDIERLASSESSRYASSTRPCSSALAYARSVSLGPCCTAFPAPQEASITEAASNQAIRTGGAIPDLRCPATKSSESERALRAGHARGTRFDARGAHQRLRESLEADLH